MKCFAFVLAAGATSLLASIARAQTATTPAIPDLAYHAPAPEVLDYEEGEPIPRGYHVESRINRGVAITGAGVFGGFWAVSVLAGCGLNFISGAGGGGGTDRYAKLFIPVAGPFMMFADKQAAHGDPLWISLGVGQSIGLLVGAFGLFPREKFVRDDVPKPKVWPTPIVTATSQGFGLAGTF